jgi:hypothetical protein
LSGIWTYGDIHPIPGNHDKAVPLELWLEAHEGFVKPIKPRGRAIRHEPLEWNGLLWCCNHDEPRRISGHVAKGSYRCQRDYVQGQGPGCIEIATHLLDKPLTKAVLQRLDFTPFAEEVLMQLEADSSHVNTEEEQRKKEIVSLSSRLKNLKSYLGDTDKKREDYYWEQIEETQHRLEELSSRPMPVHRILPADYEKVRNFLAGISDNWASYSRTMGNRLLSTIVNEVEIRHTGQDLTATIKWKTGQVQVVSIRRPRALSNLESRWRQQEKDILQMLWPESSREAILAALSGRTWSAITHEAYLHKWKRTRGVRRTFSRSKWSSDDNRVGKELYESGMMVGQLAVRLGRSITAVRQRASDKGWKRLRLVVGVDGTDQSPGVSNGITSGLC